MDTQYLKVIRPKCIVFDITQLPPTKDGGVAVA